jgi:hypothetical protein
MLRADVTALGLVAGLLAVAPATAEEPVSGTPLYTNADLERFDVTPRSSTAGPIAPAPGEDGDWQFVADHLAREYARIDAERVAAVERQWAETGPARHEGNAYHGSGVASWGWGYPFWFDAGHGRDCRHEGRTHRPDFRDDGHVAPHDARSRITPLHARDRLVPMPRTRGADSVPGPDRPASHARGHRK